MALGVALLALLGAFSFGAIVRVALADHYHQSNFINHGLVHGDSTIDGSYHSRVESPYLYPSTNYCYVYEASAYIEGVATYGTDTCNAWSGRDGQFHYECRGIAIVEVTQGGLSQHAHYSHYGYNNNCVV